MRDHVEQMKDIVRGGTGEARVTREDIAAVKWAIKIIEAKKLDPFGGKDVGGASGI